MTSAGLNAKCNIYDSNAEVAEFELLTWLSL